MDTTQQLLDTVSAALRTAGYTNVIAQTDAAGSVITAKKDPGGAYFRIANAAKARVPAQTAAGAPERQAAPLEVMMAPAYTSLHDTLVKTPAMATAIGFSDDAVKLLK